MCGYVTLLELLKDRLHSDERRWPCAPELGLGGDGYGQVADIECILRGWAGVANAAPMNAARCPCCGDAASCECKLEVAQLGVCNMCDRKMPHSQLKTCARCKSVEYCGRHCQKADWKAHKRECSRSVIAQHAGNKEEE
jgi:hypothetical protein